MEQCIARIFIVCVSAFENLAFESVFVDFADVQHLVPCVHVFGVGWSLAGFGPPGCDPIRGGLLGDGVADLLGLGIRPGGGGVEFLVELHGVPLGLVVGAPGILDQQGCLGEPVRLGAFIFLYRPSLFPLGLAPVGVSGDLFGGAPPVLGLVHRGLWQTGQRGE